MNTEGLRGLGAIEDFAIRRPDRTSSAWVRALIERNSIIVLATTDGHQPWVAPLEYMADEDLNFFFFSLAEARHVRHLEVTSTVAAVVFDREQPKITATTTAGLNGVQMECTASRVSQEGYTDAVAAAIDALDISIPPYAVFKVVPHRFYVPAVENGLITRHEVDMA
ncbi:MAG: pyridoxamine 5'-phosphate oxidase family protein [Acidimicrobiia bacterium]